MLLRAKFEYAFVHSLGRTLTCSNVSFAEKSRIRQQGNSQSDAQRQPGDTSTTTPQRRARFSVNRGAFQLAFRVYAGTQVHTNTTHTHTTAHRHARRTRT